MAVRETYSLDEIKGMLLDRRHQVAENYARPTQGSYTDKGAYFTLNPGRPDRSVGSFVIWLDGPKMGKFRDFASGDHGDLLDLIALSLGCSLKDALAEARTYLGLSTDSPEDQARRKAAAERGRQIAAEAKARAAEDAEKKRRNALRLWLDAKPSIANTPAEFYLRDARGIDLRALGRQPGSLRFAPSCFYRHTDKKTGEIIEGRWPALLAIVTSLDGQNVACHRIWLALGADGRWGKAPVPEPKKALGDYAGAAIRIWRGIGPTGQRARRLNELEAGSRVLIAEGIEDALSAVILKPDAHVLCAISLSNMGGVKLPKSVTEVTLIGDRDASPDAQAQLQAAVEAHAKAGRRVRVWQNNHGGKDLNDALKAAKEGEAA